MKYANYNDVIIDAIASQITSLTIVFSTVYLDTDQRKHQSSASLAGGRWIPRTNGQQREKNFLFDDVIMSGVYCAFVLFCFGYILILFGFISVVYPYPPGLFLWHWSNRMLAPIPVNELTLKDMGKFNRNQTKPKQSATPLHIYRLYLLSFIHIKFNSI